MHAVTIETPGLGDRSYVVVHDGTAVVVDPQRDIDRVLAVVADHDATVTHVVETHIHNDYVTGGLTLARQLDVPYVVNADDDVAFERMAVRDGDVLHAGQMRIRVIATPGHTFTHLSYAFEVDGSDGNGAGEDPRADERAGDHASDADADRRQTLVCTGGSLLYGSTGRPDLLGAEHTHALASHQWDSAQRLVAELPGTTAVLPTHGFGSFCAATAPSGADHSTLTAEADANPALIQDRDTFIATIIDGLGAHPAYYAHMSPANSAGPGPIDLSPPSIADVQELRRRMDAGEWVIDLRNQTAYAPGHVQGTLNFGLGDDFVTWLGWLIPWGTPLTLLGSTHDDIAAAQRELVRIGIDRPAAAAVGTPDDWTDQPLARHRVVDFPTLAQELADGEALVVLDVRRDDERDDSHIPGSVHIPLQELQSRVGELSPTPPVWIHCAGGYRASIAASMLGQAGIEVVAIDDDFDNAADAGLTRQSPPDAPTSPTSPAPSATDDPATADMALPATP